ncbi:hypothetical protein BJV78DRAFT_1158552 [Lactifluus subvellereus]|nr:hypothetical protein BJV78DRAFT_1158552 [Lactifluus subvellereus]
MSGFNLNMHDQWGAEGGQITVPTQLKQDISKPGLNVPADDSTYVLASSERNWGSCQSCWFESSIGNEREKEEVGKEEVPPTSLALVTYHPIGRQSGFESVNSHSMLGQNEPWGTLSIHGSIGSGKVVTGMILPHANITTDARPAPARHQIASPGSILYSPLLGGLHGPRSHLGVTPLRGSRLCSTISNSNMELHVNSVPNDWSFEVMPPFSLLYRALFTTALDSSCGCRRFGKRNGPRQVGVEAPPPQPRLIAECRREGSRVVVTKEGLIQLKITPTMTVPFPRLTRVYKTLGAWARLNMCKGNEHMVLSMTLPAVMAAWHYKESHATAT